MKLAALADGFERQRWIQIAQAGWSLPARLPNRTAPVRASDKVQDRTREARPHRTGICPVALASRFFPIGECP